jgi:hypothetical protein
VKGLHPHEESPLDKALGRISLWRHAAICLLDAHITGRPLNFHGKPIPDEIATALAVHHALTARRPQTPTRPRIRDNRPAARLQHETTQVLAKR